MHKTDMTLSYIEADWWLFKVTAVDYSDGQHFARVPGQDILYHTLPDLFNK